MKTTSPDDLIDRSLLAAAANGDRAAFKRLYRRYETRVHGYVKSIVRNPQAAEDVVVATMTTVWQSASSYASKSRVSTWILGIARHKAIDKLRSQMCEPAMVTVESALELTDLAASAFDVIDAEQRSDSMRYAMSRLGAEHREALRLAYYEDLPYGEIAQLLGIPANTVKSRVFYAKQELKRLLLAPFAASCRRTKAVSQRAAIEPLAADVRLIAQVRP
jgi:RNA polymerase sigma-70 factor (ECF subfamily)